MKIHCHRPSLAAAFQVVSGVVPSRTPKDILKNVMLQVADGKAVLIGTDQEIGIRYEIPGVEIESPGEILLPTSRIISILRELQDDGVDLEIDDSVVLVRSGHSEFRLSLEDSTEFPPVTAPTLFIYGKDSGPFQTPTLNDMWEWVEGDLTIHVLPGVGHNPHTEVPEFVTPRIMEWLATRR